MRNFDWGNTIERAVWTSLQVPAVVSVLDAFNVLEVPATSLLWAALGGFLVSAVKTIAKDRLAFLNREGNGDV